MKISFRFIETSRRGYIKVIVILLVLFNLIAVPFQNQVKAAGANCRTSSPTGSAYTVTPCFTSPADGVTVSGDQTISVSVTVVGPSTGISKLIFYLNGQYLITVFQNPYTFVLPTNKWVDGSQVLAVAVTMRDGFISHRSAITPTFNNGVLTPPVNNNTFTPTSGTTPPSGQPFILAAVGDGADGATDAGNVTNLIASWNPNLFLYLGDVYENGTFTEFSNWYGSPSTFYGRFRSITDPVVGNHEYLIGPASGYFDYWNNIPNYYSYDAAGWHFIALNSNCGQIQGCAAGQAEYQWLLNDLNTHSNACTIAYYHHPVYNVGPQGYATSMKAIWSLMAQHGVDIVLNGHDHDYQRWVPLDGNGVSSPTGITEFVAGGGGHGTQQFSVTDKRLAIGFTASPDAFGALRMQLNQNGAIYQYINYLGSVLDSGAIPCNGNSVPAAANPITPTGNIGTNYSPTYTWNQVTGSSYYRLSVDGPSGNLLYQWYTSAQTNCNGSTCSIAPALTLSGGAYTWKIQTWSPAGAGPWSTPMSFSTTVIGIPGAATLSSPTGNIGTNYSPTYTWNQVTGSSYYRLSVDGPSGNLLYQWYTSAQTNCNGTTCSIAPAVTLAGGAYTWKIQTWSPAGAGPWSSTMSFTVGP